MADLDDVLGGFEDTQAKWSIFDDDYGRIYVDERAVLHEGWLEAELRGEPQEICVALVLAGGPGSGKSTLLDERLSPPSPHTKIDPDAFKARFPEYKLLVEAGDSRAAEVCHEESSDLAARLLARAIARRHHIVLDQVGGGPPGRFLGKLVQLVSAGYRVEVVYADTAVETAIDRARIRATKTGRIVPEDLIRAKHAEVAARYQEVLEHDGIAAIELWACDEETRMVARHEAGRAPEILDQSRLEAFLHKAEDR